MPDTADSLSLVDRVRAKNVRALSRLISQIEDEEPGVEQLLASLYRDFGRALRIGMTGPPGAGKSTLVNLIAQLLLTEQKSVGIVAVDPTSPFTGGALLGDRVRMNEFPVDAPIYFRSMATRGAGGGLAAATGNVTIAYDAFGFDVTLIETVGVGQVELDIVDACDVVVVVLVPESGDSVQTMKAGLMEIGDLFCINKSDRPGAERIAAELKMTLDTRKRASGSWRPPIISTDAISRKNIDQLHAAIGQFVAFRKASGEFDQHRRAQVRRKIADMLQARFQREVVDRLLASTGFENELDSISSGASDPFTVTRRLFAAARDRADSLLGQS